MEKINIISQSALFHSLTETEREDVSHFSEIYSYDKNEIVFKSGSMSKSLYIVQKGKVIVRKTDDSGKETIVADYRTGNYFGEIDLFCETPHSESTYTSEKTNLIHFPKEGYSIKEFFTEYPLPGAKILQNALMEISQRIRGVNNLVKNNSPIVEMLRHRLFTDSFTGLNNTTFLKEQISERISSGKSFTIATFKPDNFKEINDKYGHDAGDKAIKIIAASLQGCVPENYIPARRAGNEHAVLIDIVQKNKIRSIVKKIHKAITLCDLTPIIQNDEFQLSVSFGIARSNIIKTGDELLQLSHDLTLQGRSLGGNKILFEDGTS